MKTGVLLMAHGAPDSPDEMEAYLRNVMRHRPPTPEFVREMQGRYRQIGGRSPLADITRRQADLLAQHLGMPVTFGMRTWRPYIADQVKQLADCDRIIGVCLAPHESKFSTALYREALIKAAPVPAICVLSWATQRHLLELWKRNILKKLDPDTAVIFTAHSVPETPGDPYAAQVRATAEGVASLIPGLKWELCWQSRSPGGGTWLGPDINEKLESYRGRSVLIAPIGFVSDHTEVLYDLDIVARRTAERLGIRFQRAEMPNTDPLLIQALAEVVALT